MNTSDKIKALEVICSGQGGRSYRRQRAFAAHTGYKAQRPRWWDVHLPAIVGEFLAGLALIAYIIAVFYFFG